MALAASGLMLQTTFNNPLADPSILGISSGARLGVALVMLAGAGTITAGVFTLSLIHILNELLDIINKKDAAGMRAYLSKIREKIK